MRPNLPALDHGRMDLVPARYMIRINGHLGATMLSAFPALAPQHHGAHTVLTGSLDQSALSRLMVVPPGTVTRPGSEQAGESPRSGDAGSPARR
jgi:hypothetical protein